MATFKLGAIITDIQGSISGTTIRRTPTGHTMYNKQGTQIKSAFAVNNRRAIISKVIQSWSLLDKTEQDEWATLAGLTPVKDKFNNLKFLTGRQFYIKANTQLIPTATVSDVNDYDTFIPQAVCSMGEEYPVGDDIDIDFDTAVTGSFLYVEIYRLTRAGRVKPHAHFKRTASAVLSSATTFNIKPTLMSLFPLYAQGQYYGVNLMFVNPFGLITSTQSFKFQLTP